MEISNIILWSVSITLAVFGAIFGVQAYRYSSKANKQIKELIQMSWITDEASKYFFDNLKDLIIENKKALKYIKRKDAYFSRYKTVALLTRMKPFSKKIKEALKESEFRDIASEYKIAKVHLDEKFIKAIEDMAILSSDNKITAGIKKQLIEYHTDVIKHASLILKEYTDSTMK